MTVEVLVIGAIRILGSLPVLRWPLAGGILAILVDLSDLLLRDTLDLGGIPDYQAFDKWVDQVYLAAFLVVALRWRGPERAIAIGLYVFRLVGFVAFEVTGERALLLLFPNVFEPWFLVVAAIHRFRPGFTWRPVVTGGDAGGADRPQGGPGVGAPRRPSVRRDLVAGLPRCRAALADRRQADDRRYGGSAERRTVRSDRQTGERAEGHVAEIGTVLGGRYRLVELLGQGGMATIYRAHDSQLDRDVAVKLLRPEYGRDPDFGSRFRQEAHNAASLNHPNIVSVFDYGQDTAGPFIVMELVEGEDLASIIRRSGALPPRQAARIAAETARALAGRPRARDRPPRREARQHPHQPRWPGQGHRLRDRPGRRRGADDAAGHDARVGPLLQPGTGPRRAGHGLVGHLRRSGSSCSSC